jgi:hypothetical protein
VVIPTDADEAFDKNSPSIHEENLTNELGTEKAFST